MPLPDIHPFVRHPNEDSYREARSRLLLQYLLGDNNAATALAQLPVLHHFLTNYDYYSVLYGSKRATSKLLQLLSSIRSDSKDKVSTLLELYKVDNTYLEQLVDAILNLKVEITREGAPENLLKLFDETIASADSSKKTAFIRKVQIILSYVRLFRESGPEQVSRAVDVLLNRVSAPSAPQVNMPVLKPPSDADQLSLLRHIAESNVSGIAPTKDDILNFFGGDAVKATSLLQRLRSGTAPKVTFDKELGGLVVTPIGLQQLSEDGILSPVEVRRLVAYIKRSPYITKLVSRGIFKPPEVVAGFAADKEGEDVAEDDEEDVVEDEGGSAHNSIPKVSGE